VTALARTLIAGATLAGTVGCAPASSTPAQAGEPQTAAAPAPARQRKDPTVITEQEIATRQTLTARQVIEQLRPQFLRVRGTTTLGNAATQDVIWVYVDGTRHGNLEVLNNISANEIREIRYLSPSEATNRYGTGHVQGAILITRK
jgi:hypothetical protein